MIHHLSIAARDPKHVAAVLAEIMGGASMPFPANPGSHFARQLDAYGTGVEVYPVGTTLRPGGGEGSSFVRENTGERSYTATHFALSVSADVATVKKIARREGWQYNVCDRGRFHVVEVWIENETMVEVLPPKFTREYLSIARPEKIVAAHDARRH